VSADYPDEIKIKFHSSTIILPYGAGRVGTDYNAGYNSLRLAAGKFISIFMTSNSCTEIL